MGVWLKNVPVKLDEKTVQRMDQDVQRFSPFCTGRSQLGRLLIHLAYAQIDNGEVDWTLSGIQRALKRKPNTKPNP